MTFSLRIAAAGSALALAAACAIPLGAQTGAVPGADSPLGCALTVTEAMGQTSVAARIEARKPVSGTWDLKLGQSGRGGMADIRQGGAFRLAAGETAELALASLSGPADSLDGTLTVAIDGRSYACPITAD